MHSHRGKGPISNNLSLSLGAGVTLMLHKPLCFKNLVMEMSLSHATGLPAMFATALAEYQVFQELYEIKIGLVGDIPHVRSTMTP